MNVRLQILSANKLAESLGNGAPAEIRTRDPRLRRPVLYPTELRAPVCAAIVTASAGSCDRLDREPDPTPDLCHHRR